MNVYNTVSSYVATADARFVEYLSQHSYTSNLIENPLSKTITQILFVGFIVLFWYELVYCSGIYLGLWEYHAKDIFKEVPVHCAHVYVRLNVVKKSDVEKVRLYYQLKRQSPYNILKWNSLNEKGHEVFELNRFVKYHFEFSPEDFENNPQPEWGSTVEHLRRKTLTTFLESSIHSKFYPDVENIPVDNVLIFNNKTEEVTHDHDKMYLSKICIETGNIIDTIILV